MTRAPRCTVVFSCMLALGVFLVPSQGHSQLVAHWPLDGGFENLADETFDGYLPVGIVVDFVDVVPNEDGSGPLQDLAANFTGANSHVMTDYPGIGGANPRTIAFWAKTGRAGANHFLGYGRPTDGQKWHMLVNTNATDGPVGAIRTAYQGGRNVGIDLVDDGQWHHVAAVFRECSTRGLQIDHYVDGVLQTKSGGDRDISTGLDPAFTVTVGWSREATTNPTQRTFLGQIADVRFYDEGLTEEGVLAVMDGDDPPVTPPRDVCTDLTVVCTTSVETNSVIAELTAEPDGCLCCIVQVSANGVDLGERGVDADGILRLRLDELCSAAMGEEIELTVTCAGSETSGSCTIACPASEGLVAHWELNEGTGDIFEDSISGFDGYLPDFSTVEWVDGPPAQDFGVYFSGADSWIQTDFPGIGNAWPRTIAFWMKSTATNNHGIVSWGADAGGQKWHIRLNNNAGNGQLQAIRIEVNGGYNIGTTVLNDDVWHHVALVVPPGSTMVGDIQLYVDGVLDPPSNVNDRAFDTLVGEGAQPLAMGRRLAGANLTPNYYPGALADLRIYDEALDADAIFELFGDPPPQEICDNGTDDDGDGDIDCDDEDCADECVEEGLGFLRGDCNGDGNVSGQVGDAIYVLNFNFLGGPVPPCMAACDSNGDGNVAGQVGDAIYTLNFNFLGGALIPEPFPDCGRSTDEGDLALGCETEQCP